ncbi:MAG: acyltransferase [Armatimonadota bacterium]
MSEAHVIIRGRDRFMRYKKVIVLLSKLCCLLPQGIRNQLYEGCRNATGTLGLLVRYALLKSITNTCGDNVSVHPGVYIFNAPNISIGNNVSVHPMCYIDGAGGIEIGNDVSIAHNVTVMSSSHTYDIIDTPIKDQTVSLKRTVIKDNVWIGAKVTILYGCTIGNGSIIAANCVVTKDVLPNHVVAGVPARVMKVR